MLRSNYDSESSTAYRGPFNFRWTVTPHDHKGSLPCYTTKPAHGERGTCPLHLAALKTCKPKCDAGSALVTTRTVTSAHAHTNDGFARGSWSML